MTGPFADTAPNATVCTVLQVECQDHPGPTGSAEAMHRPGHISPPDEPGHPGFSQLPNLREDVGVGLFRRLEDMEAVVGPLQPTHGPLGPHTLHRLFHQVLPAQTIAGAVEAQRRRRDGRKMRVAKLFGSAGWMKGI